MPPGGSDSEDPTLSLAVPPGRRRSRAATKAEAWRAAGFAPLLDPCPCTLYHFFFNVVLVIK